MSHPAAFYLAKKDTLTAAGLNLDLLEVQHKLVTAAVPREGLVWLSRLSTSLQSTASASALDAAGAGGNTTVAQQRKKCWRILGNAGLRGLAATDAVSSYAVFLETGAYKSETVLVGSERYTELIADGDNLLLGNVHARDATTVILSALLNATQENFYTDFAPEYERRRDADSASEEEEEEEEEEVDLSEDPNFERIYTSPATADGWGALQAKLRQQFQTVPGLKASGDGAGLRATPLGLLISKDGTVKSGGTSDRKLMPIYCTVANFHSDHLKLPGATATWAHVTTFTAPADMPAARASLCRRLLDCACMDVVYSQLYDLRHGLLWELAPSNVLLLVPRVLWRPADWPERKLQNLLAASAMAGRPCSICTVTRAGAGSTLPSLRRDVWDIIKHARTLPASSYYTAAHRREGRAAIAAAKAYGSTPTGRTPAPFTKFARAISSCLLAHMLSPPDTMHTVRMLCRILGELIVREALGMGLTSATLEARRAALPAFHGAATRFTPPTASEMQEGRKLPISAHVSSLLVLSPWWTARCRTSPASRSSCCCATFATWRSPRCASPTWPPCGCSRTP